MLTVEQKATNYDTMRHIERVRNLLGECCRELLRRAELHDQSKLESPEVEAFAEYTPKLAASTYGSPEYEGFRRAMGPALAHHYARNRHHPEHFPPVDDGEVARLRALLKLCVTDLPADHPVTDHVDAALLKAKAPVGHMTLVDLLEMLCDWKAASERHNDGNILKSIEVNAERFGITPQLCRVLENTARAMGLVG